MTTPTEIPESRRDWGIFEKELPNYWNREVVPSVSQLLTWEFGAPPNITPVQIGIDRGRKVHHALQLKDEEDLDQETIAGHGELLKYIRQWESFLVKGDHFMGIERPLWGTLVDIDYIVRPDRVIQRGDKILIVDIKTKSAVGKPPDAKEQQRHALEIAAQKIAVAQRLGPLASWAGCVYLWPHKCQVMGYNDAKFVDQFGALLGRWADARITSQAAGE